MKVNPAMDMMSLLFGMDELNYLAKFSYNNSMKKTQQSTVESALVTLENDTGYILAMIGGSEFNRSNQFNRAVNGELMPRFCL